MVYFIRPRPVAGGCQRSEGTLRRIGEIMAVSGKDLTVAFCHMEHCGSCHACEGGQSQAEVRLRLPEGKMARTGDFAEIDMPSASLVKASLFVYLFPLAAFLGGLALGYVLFPSAPEAGAAVLALLGLGIVLLAVHLGEKKRAASPEWQPQLVRIIPRELHDRPVENR